MDIYGIGIRNRFELIADDVEDPEDDFQRQQSQIERLKSEKKTETKVGESSGTKAKTEKSLKESGDSLSASGVQDDSKKSSINREESPSKIGVLSTTESPESEGSSWMKETRKKRGHAAKGRRRESFKARDSEVNLQREYDRQSGSTKSCVKPIEKKEGSGAYNWGAIKDAIQFEESVISEEGNQAKQLSPVISSELETPDKDDSSMTLAEWMEKEKTTRSVPKYNFRKAGEGVALKWNEAYQIKKKETEDEEEEEEDEEKEWIQRGRKKRPLNIDIQFNEPCSRGRGRRARNDARRAKTGTSETVPPKAVPKVDDYVDFPSLS